MRFFWEAIENAETPEERARRTLVEDVTKAQETANVLMRVEQEQAAIKSAKAKGPSIGDVVEGKGIFAGPISYGLNGEWKTFKLFAAPEDLKSESGQALWGFEEAADEILTRKGPYGHGTEVFTSATELLSAIWDGEDGGRWFIPGASMLVSLYENRGEGALKKLHTTNHRTSEKTDLYMACNEGGVCAFDFSKGLLKVPTVERRSVRLCRVERELGIK
jgi:hypothetical protein